MGYVSNIETIKIDEEKMLCFPEADEDISLGCFGAVKGYFGDDEKYYCNWFEGQNAKNLTEEIKTEINEVIKELKKDILCSSKNMYEYCRDKDNARNYLTTYRAWEFRLLTNKCSMYLVCQIENDETNLDIYVYDKKTLFNELAKRRGLPLVCYTIIPSTDHPIIVRFGETGYYPCALETKDEVDEYNEKLGVTPAKREAMTAGSMFGWNAPCADPKNYDESGKPINKGEREER